MAMRELGSGASGILSYFTRHRTAANLLLVIMLVLGLSSTTQIRSQFFPDVVLDSVNVNIAWPGAGPEDVDNAIVALIEPALLTVEGVTETRSTAREGRASIRLEFEPNWDMSRAAEDVKTAVDAVNGLPSDAEDPVVRRGQWRDRVTDVVIHGPVSADQLGLFADEFAARLFREGVTRTTIRGVAAPEILVEAKSLDLIRNNITLGEIASVIGEEAEADPAGDIADGSARIRAGIEKRRADELAEIVIRANPDGSKLRVGDVATIRATGTDESRTYFVGENQAVSIRVDRADQGDAIKMQATVQRVADEMQLSMPEDVKIELIRTRAQAIQDRLNILLKNGGFGLLLVIGLLFLFLSARTAFWVAAGIPVAMFAALALMYAWGITLNMVSLFGLIITLGIVVDDAIVVGEHADFRARRLGEDPVTASENAARRMAPPVFSATITTIIAFWGLTLVGGRFGELIADIPFTVIVVLAASLVECFIILPNHMSHSLGYHAKMKWYDIPSHYFNLGFSWFRETVFRPFMKFVLVFRYPVLAGTVLLLALNAALFFNGEVRFRFINFPERSSASGNIAMLPNAQKEDTLQMVRELQRAVDKVGTDYENEYGANPILFAMAEIGGNTGRGLAGTENKLPEQLGSIAIELIDADERPYSSFELISSIQEEIRRHPLLETVSFRGFRFGPQSDSLAIQFFGPDSATLKAASEALKLELEAFPEVSALEDDLSFDKEELVLELTAQGQALGFTIDQVGRDLRNRLNGIEAASFPNGVRTSEITVKLPDSELGSDFLDAMQLRTREGNYVPVRDVVTVSTSLGFSTLLRENGLRLITVTGDLSEDDPDRANFVVTELENRILPDIAKNYGVDFNLSGQAADEQEFLTDALVGYALCLLGIYLTLTWIFASWTRPIVVMAIIPFGFIGTIYGHWVWDVPLSMFSIVGIIGMSGIIINDSIVLITTVDEYSKNRGLYPAIIDAACDRLRPVVLTTLTTVLGLLPLLYEGSRQALFLKPTVITLVFGLGFGLLLVLLLVPALLIIGQDVARLFQSLRRGLFGRHISALERSVLYLSNLGILGLVGSLFGWLIWYREPFPLLADWIGQPAIDAPVAISLAVLAGGLIVWLLLCVFGYLGIKQLRRA